MKSLLYVLCCIALVFVFYHSTARVVVAEDDQNQKPTEKKTESLGERYARQGLERAYGIGDHKPVLDFNLGPRELNPSVKAIQSHERPEKPDFTLPKFPKFDENETVIRSASDNLRPLSPEDQQFLDDWSVLSWERRDGREFTTYQNGVRTIYDGKKMTVLYRGEVHSFDTHEHPEQSLWQEQREILQRLEWIRNNAEIEIILELGESYDHLPPATKHQWSTPRLPGTQR